MDNGRVVFKAAKLSIPSWQLQYIIFSDRKSPGLGFCQKLLSPQLDSSLMQSLLENCLKLKPSNTQFWNEEDGRDSTHHKAVHSLSL